MEDSRRMNCPCSDLKVHPDCDIHDHNTFEPNCPKCGEGVKDRQTYSSWTVLYKCGTGQITIRNEKKLFIGDSCYRHQLASANDRVKELEERCQSLLAHAILNKKRIEDLETWARELIKEEKLYPYDYWPDCGKPYLYCGACGADLGKGKEHEISCSWLKASELGLV
jgi:hypothetical protein